MYSFEQIIGNQQAVKIMRNALFTKMLSHAYIITGPEGSGKKTLVNTFAKGAECESDTNRPCGKCTSCKVFDSNNHPDIIVVKPSKTKALGVDDIREQIVEAASIKTYHYQYKIFLIFDADTMTIPAQNALLKTLEEPPPNVMFLLTASNLDGFLPTILSRSVVIKTQPLTPIEISAYLKKKTNLSDALADVYAEYAQGSLGMALKIAESEEFFIMREKVIDLLKKIHQSDMVTVMGMSKELEPYKDSMEFLDFIYLWYRDLLALQRLEESFVIQKDKIQEIVSAAQQETLSGLLKKLDAVWHAKRSLMQNANFLLTMEIMLLTLKEN